jgi:hypothetical protein
MYCVVVDDRCWRLSWILYLTSRLIVPNIFIPSASSQAQPSINGHYSRVRDEQGDCYVFSPPPEAYGVLELLESGLRYQRR